MVKELKNIIEAVIEEYGIAKDRIFLTGSSMGGYGTWEMAMCYPEMFAAIAPVAGGGVVWRTGKLVKTPVIAYHGEKDTVVPASQSEIMVNFTNNNGGVAELNILKDKEHNEKNEVKNFNVFGKTAMSNLKNYDMVALGVVVTRVALDCNNDGVINNHDLLTMMKYLRGEEITIQ
jgi:predicted peptidase